MCVCVCDVIRTNDEFKVMYRKLNIVRRPEWAGHLVRMCDNGTVKIVFLWKPVGRRKSERLKLRLLDCTENGVKSNGVTKCRKKTKKRFICMCCYSQRGAS